MVIRNLLELNGYTVGAPIGPYESSLVEIAQCIFVIRDRAEIFSVHPEYGLYYYDGNEWKVVY
jgi:hypothetical protein